MCYPPAAILAKFRILPDLGEAFVGFQRIAAGGNEIDRGVKIRACERYVRRGPAHFPKKLVGKEWRAYRAPENMLRQYVERAGEQRRCVLRILCDRIYRRTAIKKLDTV